LKAVRIINFDGPANAIRVVDIPEPPPIPR
jgi:hypothetical protein